jgi:predicted transcriptional regulator
MESLESLFSSRVRLALLRILFTQPSKRFYGRELARLSGERQSAVWRELQNLEQSGFVVRSEDANMTYFRVQSRHPLFDELRCLILKAAAGDGMPLATATANPRETSIPGQVAAPQPRAGDLVIGEND